MLAVLLIIAGIGVLWLASLVLRFLFVLFVEYVDF
jgi:hypothetical protein